MATYAIMDEDAAQRSTYCRDYNPATTRKPRHDPAPHQEQALGKMAEWYRPEQNLGGILALPTGGGKSFVATHFLCRHPLSDGYRILWLAHTHHLLEQALKAFDNTMSVVSKSIKTVRIRVVSGSVGHFRLPNIDGSENVLLCTLQTATGALKERHPKFMNFLSASNDGAGLFVVFDEAHHAPAPSYRRLLEGIRDICRPFGLLGLTATPTYSNERKQGWLKRLFPQGIVAQADAKNLMADGVLARPILEDVRTKVKPEFNEQDYQKWVSTYRDLPPGIINSLAENKSRNESIATHYVNNKEKYGKAIMFADRWFQCDYLREALRMRGVRADAVYAHKESVRGGAEARNRRPLGHNAKVLRSFKNDELDVLINVQMLTEGTDVPGVQTVFLTRQTTSEILLKQMVGRALRGPKFGGTENAHIVSFIDNWQQHIDWATYDQIREGIIDDEQPKHGMRKPLQLISVELVRHLARQMDSGLNISPAPYKTLLPVGWYQIEYDAVVCGGTGDAVADDTESVRRLIMVYEHDHEQLKQFITRLQDLHKHGELRDFEHSDLERVGTLNRRLECWQDKVFGGDCDRPGMVENLLDLARHVAQKYGARPHFFPFHEQKDHDLDAIASRYIYKNLGPREVDELLHSEYARHDRLWRSIYAEYDQFKSGYDACVNRILHAGRHGSDPDDHQPNFVTPEDHPETEPSDETKKEVKVRDMYRCLCCGSEYGRWLEVDHITPNYLRMDHRLENLQTLCRRCNNEKGGKTIDFRNHRTMLTQCPDGFSDGRLPDIREARDMNNWKMYLRRTVNLFYRCSAVKDIRIGSRGERFRTWSILLFQGNEPDWLRSHLPILVERIRQARIKAGVKAAPEKIEIDLGGPLHTEDT